MGVDKVRKEIIEYLYPLNQEETEALGNSMNIDRSIYMNGSGDVVRAEKLLEKGRVVALRPHTRLVTFPFHSHSYVELVYVAEGKMVHIINNKKIELKKGEILLLGEGVEHAIAKTGINDIAMNVIIRPSFFSSIISSFTSSDSELKSFILDTLKGKENSGYLHFFVENEIPIQNLMENLVWAYVKKIPQESEIYRSTLSLLFTHLISSRLQAEIEDEDKATLFKVFSYIYDNYKEGTLEECADSVGYSVTALSRMIKRETGKTWTDLLKEKRLSIAVWFLQNTKENIDDISRSVGYENVSYFHRLFRAKYHMGPKEFRDARKDTFLDK